MVQKIFFSLLILNGLTINLHASLLSKEDLDERNYVKVHVWNPSLLSSYSATISNQIFQQPANVGHASLEIAEKDADREYISLWPGDAYKDNLGHIRRQGRIQTYTQDVAAEQKKPETIVMLYSINRKNLLQHFHSVKSNLHYEFVNDPSSEYLHNCSSIVLKLLKRGSIEDLFPARENLSYLAKSLKIAGRCATVTGGTMYVGATSGTFAFGPWGGLAGAVGGLGFGLLDIKGQTTKAYAEWAEKDDDLSELVVDPNRISSLALKAYNHEQNMFKNWRQSNSSMVDDSESSEEVETVVVSHTSVAPTPIVDHKYIIRPQELVLLMVKENVGEDANNFKIYTHWGYLVGHTTENI